MFSMTVDHSQLKKSSYMTYGIIPAHQAGWTGSRLKEKCKIPQNREKKNLFDHFFQHRIVETLRQNKLDYLRIFQHV